MKRRIEGEERDNEREAGKRREGYSENSQQSMF